MERHLPCRKLKKHLRSPMCQATTLTKLPRECVKRPELKFKVGDCVRFRGSSRTGRISSIGIDRSRVDVALDPPWGPMTECIDTEGLELTAKFKKGDRVRVKPLPTRTHRAAPRDGFISTQCSNDHHRKCYVLVCSCPCHNAIQEEHKHSETAETTKIVSRSSMPNQSPKLHDAVIDAMKTKTSAACKKNNHPACFMLGCQCTCHKERTA